MALRLAYRSKITAPCSADARIIQYRALQHAAFYTVALVHTAALLALESLALLVYSKH